MTIKPAVRISESKLVVKDRTILTGVPDNVMATSGSSSGPVDGVFLGVVFDQENSRHVVSLGALRDVRFMACFRFKLWWMAQKMGDQGRDIPLETQFLLVETKDGSHLESDGGDEENQIVYTVFLPLIEGSFRACLQGNVDDELELCLESGDAETKRTSFSHSVFIHAGTDPFRTITEAVRAVKLHLKTFRQRHEKKLPGIVDYFGWCTWDAFYQEVTQEGVEAGLESLASGGTPPKFVIIDDGWQSVGGDPQEESNDQDEKKENQQPLLRLTGIKENAKFQKKDDPTAGIKSIVNALDASVARNFPDNGCIACMSHNTDALYCDAPGKHNFELLKKLILPDGSILRARLPGRPTRDCLFSDPARDGVSLLKIWNMNKFTGVLGVYNCQGAAWNNIERKNTFHQTKNEVLTGAIRGRDVHLIAEAAMDPNWDGNCAVYCHRTGELITLPYNAALPMSLKVLEHDIFTVTPIKDLAPGFSFAPLGLINMFNAGGAIEGLKYEVKGGAELLNLDDGYKGESSCVSEQRVENYSDELVGKVSMEVKGCGKFGAYSSAKPRKCIVDANVVEFLYDSDSSLVSLSLDSMPEEGKLHVVEIEL
ncbi:hypothetical protein H0E87_029248 [Populus deltoides]|uniref:galactinol--sucrose galactosyltransferase n=1 Tax=Populus deltoides TaxID=3696 RepID=A0A8T2WMA8_POPDE|nr:hypothetical protein H0E87_029248 [Populus deltoides]